MYCPDCHGTGTVRVEGKPITNEEWFCNLSTEEKAKFILKKFINGSLCDICRWDCRERCFVRSDEEEIKVVQEWLKAVHKE